MLADGARRQPTAVCEVVPMADSADYTTAAAAYAGLPCNEAVASYFFTIEAFATDVAAFPLDPALGSAPEFDPSKQR